MYCYYLPIKCVTDCPLTQKGGSESSVRQSLLSTRSMTSSVHQLTNISHSAYHSIYLQFIAKFLNKSTAVKHHDRLLISTINPLFVRRIISADVSTSSGAWNDLMLKLRKKLERMIFSSSSANFWPRKKDNKQKK